MPRASATEVIAQLAQPATGVKEEEFAANVSFRYPATPAMVFMTNADSRAWVTTSWDDGHPADQRLADLLEKHGVAATFYVPRRSNRGVMSETQIYQLSRRFEIGAHTLDHVYLDGVSDAEAEKQIAGSRQWIQDVTARECTSFGFPGGKFHKRHLRLVGKAGFGLCRSVELLSIAGVRCVAGTPVLPTTVQAFPHRASGYFRNAVKRGKLSQLLRSGALFSSNWLELAERLLARVVRFGGVFHLWGHSWELAERQQWCELEKLLALLAQHRCAARLVTNSDLLPYPTGEPAGSCASGVPAHEQK